jgi:hypothetical protein
MNVIVKSNLENLTQISYLEETEVWGRTTYKEREACMRREKLSELQIRHVIRDAKTGRLRRVKKKT